MLKIDLPQDPSVPRMAVYHKDSIYYKKYFFIHVHCCSVNSGQIFEIAYLSINCLMDNENVVHLLNIIQLLKP